MPIELFEWSVTAGNNDDNSPDGAQENWTGKEINDWGRRTMAVVRTWYDDPEWLSITNDLVGTAPRGAKTVQQIDASAFRVVGCDATAYFTAGRRVRMREGVSPPYVETHVVSSSFSANDTTVNIIGANVPATFQPDGADVYFAKSLDPGAFVAQPAVADVKLTAGLPSVAASLGWLECDGMEYLIADYPVLAAALGVISGLDGYYDENVELGSPTNATFFRVPDLRGRVPVGFWENGDTDGDYDYTAGGGGDQDDAFGGEKAHEILEAEMPAHDHDFVTDGDHTHILRSNTTTAPGTNRISRMRTDASAEDSSDPVTAAGDHDHSFVSKGDAANNNLGLQQSYTVLGYVIYSGVI